MTEETKIVINALQYRPNGSGISITLRELFGRFTSETKRKCRVILPKDSPVFPSSGKTEIIEIPYRYEEGIKRVAFQSFNMGKYCKNTILLTIDSKVPFFLPSSCRLIPLITDLAVFRLSETYQKSREILWKAQYKYLRNRATHFLTISEFTKAEMVDILGIPREKIDIIPSAASADMKEVIDSARLKEVRQKYSLPANYILFVGNFNPRKNLERLISAFDLWKEQTSMKHELVIAGGTGWKFSAESALRSIKHKGEIHFLDYVADLDMAALYSAADLFAFPTLYEGFGLPIIEAQLCGTPVLTSNISAMPEVGGEGALYVNPYDVATIADHMEKVLVDNALRNKIVCKGFENAKRFSWEASARKLDCIVERIIEEQQ